MRKPERIPVVLEKLGQLWQLYPDQRLGQMLNNLAAGRDVHAIEEGVLIKRMNAVIDNGWEVMREWRDEL